MDSPELLQLVEKCPPGGETLIMRMLHILTDCCKCVKTGETLSLAEIA